MYKLIKKIKSYIFDSAYRFEVNSNYGLYNGLSDTVFLKKKYRYRMKKELNLLNPTCFNEKLQWLKIYDRQPSYITMVDKYAVKEYVSNIIGNTYIVPTLGVWSRFKDIDFDALPNQFVLKCTHDSGGLYICRDKNTFNRNKAKRIINKSLKRNFFYHGREWPYKSIFPQIIAEPYLQDEKTGELRDYKFFCFDGEPKLMFIAANRQNHNQDTTFDFFDLQFNHLNIINGHPNSSVQIEKPVNFDLMIELAKKISTGIPHVRVDFYEVNGHPYFGECTFYHYSGFTPFEPEQWDYILGDMIHLPNKQ